MDVIVKKISEHITGIYAGDTDSKARIVVEGGYATLSLTENSCHWSGSMLNKDNVDNLIAILEVYKRDFLNQNNA